MTDRYDHDILLGYIEGELSPEQRAAFDRRLAEDEPLRRLVHQLQADRETLRSLPQVAPPRELLEDATQRLEREMLLDEPENEPSPADAAGIGAAETTDANAFTPKPPRRMTLARTLSYGALAAAITLCAGVIIVALTDTTALLQQASDFARARDQLPETAPEAMPEFAPSSPPQASGDPRSSQQLDDDAVAAAPSDDGAVASPREHERRPERPDQSPETARIEARPLARANERSIDAPYEAYAGRGARAEVSEADEAQIGEEMESDPRRAARLLDADSRAETLPDELSDPSVPAELLVESEPDLATAARAESKLGVRSAGEAPGAPLAGTVSTDAEVRSRPSQPSYRPAPGSPEHDGPILLEVSTQSAEETRRELFEWAINNEAHLRLESRQLALRVRTDQVEPLMAHLNRQPQQQRAMLASSAISQPESEPAEPAPLPQAEPRALAGVALERSDPSIIERSDRDAQVTVTLSSRQLWSQRQRLMQVLADELALPPRQTSEAAEPAAPAADVTGQTLAERRDSEPPALVEGPTTTSPTLPLDWRGRFFEDELSTIRRQLAAQSATEPGTVELEVVIREQDAPHLGEPDAETRTDGTNGT